MDAPRLSDGVVVLDAFTLDDAAAQLAGEDEEHARRFGWHPARSTEETVRAGILRWQEAWRGDGPTRAFALRTGGELAGGCELRLRGDGVAEVSYWVFPPHRRRGLATRGLGLAAAFAFDTLGVERLELYVQPENEASRGVARGAGFVEEGLVRGHELTAAGERRDMVRYARAASG